MYRDLDPEAYQAGLAYGLAPSGKFAEGYAYVSIEHLAAKAVAYSAYCEGYCEGIRQAKAQTR